MGQLFHSTTTLDGAKTVPPRITEITEVNPPDPSNPVGGKLKKTRFLFVVTVFWVLSHVYRMFSVSVCVGMKLFDLSPLLTEQTLYQEWGGGSLFIIDLVNFRGWEHFGKVTGPDIHAKGTISPVFCLILKIRI